MSKYNILEHKDEIITHIIKNLIWLPLVNVIPLIFSLVYDALQKEPTMNWIVVTSLVVSIALSITSLLITLKVKRKSEKSVMKKEQKDHKITPLTNFRINLIETELNFENRIDIISTLNYKMTANEDNVDYFEKELIWTGKDYKGTDFFRYMTAYTKRYTNGISWIAQLEM